MTFGFIESNFETVASILIGWDDQVLPGVGNAFESRFKDRSLIRMLVVVHGNILVQETTVQPNLVLQKYAKVMKLSWADVSTRAVSNAALILPLGNDCLLENMSLGRQFHLNVMLEMIRRPLISLGRCLLYHCTGNSMVIVIDCVSFIIEKLSIFFKSMISDNLLKLVSFVDKQTKL